MSSYIYIGIKKICYHKLYRNIFTCLSASLNLTYGILMLYDTKNQSPFRSKFITERIYIILQFERGWYVIRKIERWVSCIESSNNRSATRTVCSWAEIPAELICNGNRIITGHHTIVNYPILMQIRFRDKWYPVQLFRI